MAHVNNVYFAVLPYSIKLRVARTLPFLYLTVKHTTSAQGVNMPANEAPEVTLTIVHSVVQLPDDLTATSIATMTRSWMGPYADTQADCRQGILDALSGKPAPGGFVILANLGAVRAGILVMLATGMSGYIPPNLLLFIAVDGSLRRRGIASQLMQLALDSTQGPIKLHVEADNPAQRLYNKFGFKNAYLDMRLYREASS